MKEESIIKYYNGNYDFILFLLDIFYHDVDFSSDILKKQSIDAAKMGCISNILLAIKEDLVEKGDEDRFVSRIFLNQLEEAVDMIAVKTDTGYKIGNVDFIDAPEIVAFLRNKIAHGNFIFDGNYSRIILKKNNEDVTININSLSNFIAKALTKHFNKMDMLEYKRDFILSNKIHKNREKPITSLNELKGFIKSFYVFNSTLKSKTGKEIDCYTLELLKSVLNKYKETKDLNILLSFKKLIEDKYEFSYSLTRPKNIDYDKIVAAVKNVVRNDIPYKQQTLAISNELPRFFNKEYEKFNPLVANARNLILLDALYTKNTTDLKSLSEYITSKYDKIYYSIDSLATASIALFNSMFSYANDDIYKNKSWCNRDIDGLNYASLNLDKINVIKYKEENKILDVMLEEITAKEKESLEIKEKLEKKFENLKNLKDKGNIEALTRVKELVLSLTTKELTLKYDIAEINRNIAFIKANELYFKNKGIIEGIRNSIAHGNYRVVLESCMEDAKIIFEDIYEGELTFKCEVKINEFIYMMSTNGEIIDNYVQHRIEEKTKTL